MLPHYIPLAIDSCNHGFQRGWPDMSSPLAEFQRGWTDMSGPQPGHVRVSEGIDLPIYRPIYWLGWPIFGRFPPADVDFLASRPVVVRPPPWFSSAAYPPSRPTRFTVRFQPIFGPPLPILDLPDRLQLLSRPEQMGNEEYTLLLSWGDRIPYT
jgi:hypothetical protein